MQAVVLPLQSVIDPLAGLVGLVFLVKVGLVVAIPARLVGVVRLESATWRHAVRTDRAGRAKHLAGPQTLGQVLDEVGPGEPTVLRLFRGHRLGVEAEGDEVVLRQKDGLGVGCRGLFDGGRPQAVQVRIDVGSAKVQQVLARLGVVRTWRVEMGFSRSYSYQAEP